MCISLIVSKEVQHARSKVPDESDPYLHGDYNVTTGYEENFKDDLVFGANNNAFWPGT